MQQHPVPQNVTQYQFRLVGDMTLKQFLELAAGLVAAYLFYASNLIFIFKWPLALMSILFGFGLAFFPIEDRPLDQWIVNFLRSIYSPTRYIWKKSNKIPNIFTFEPHPVVETVTATKTVKAPSLTDLQAPPASDVSDEERQRLNVLDAMLAKSTPATPPKPVVSSPTIDLDKPKVEVHKLRPLSKVQTSTIFQSAPRPQPIAKPLSVGMDSVSIPGTTPTAVSKPVAGTSDSKPAGTAAGTVIFAKPTVTASKPAPATVNPVSIHLPAAPTKPNLVVGMVVDKNSKLVENAIVQIVTGDGIPARAIKTNSLGQFYTSTPLANGTYTIETEKEGMSFPVNKLVVENKIISPILLRAS